MKKIMAVMIVALLVVLSVPIGEAELGPAIMPNPQNHLQSGVSQEDPTSPKRRNTNPRNTRITSPWLQPSYHRC